MELSLKPDLKGKVAVVTGGAGVLCSDFIGKKFTCGITNDCYCLLIQKFH